VRFEGDDDGRAVVLMGVFLCCADDFLVAEVESVENTDGQGEGAGKVGKGINGAENLHHEAVGEP
ncbi:MAG: hypothetical protein R3F13_21400, partial [Prosthecobacter sp.]